MRGIVTAKEAAGMVRGGATVMLGGFMGCGSAHCVVGELVKSGVSGLTLICNDASMPGGPDGGEFFASAKLIHSGQVTKMIATHVGRNPEVTKLVNEGAMELVLVPQGSFAEMIRAGGAGLGGVLTPAGVGTMVEGFPHVHSVVEVDGRKYLLERPLRADVALIGGRFVDRAGNVWYKGTSRNFNQVMATAADLVIAEADEIVDIGFIEPENVMTPGILVDYVVEGGVSAIINSGGGKGGGGIG